MIWTVVALSRPNQVDNVRANFLRQVTSDKKICVVENGPAVGICKALGFSPDLLLTSDAHQSIARNTALEVLRKEDAQFACMDDDDYYGPNYLSEHLLFAKRGRITGKVPHWVRYSNVSKLWLFNRRKSRCPVSWVSAATLGGYAVDIPDFPVTSVGEETVLCDKHRRSGGDVFDTGLGGYLYHQGGPGHLYTISAKMFACAHGPWFEEFPDIPSDFVDLEVPRGGVKKSWRML